VTDKPPPTARSARDRQQMDKWSNEQLDDFAERSMFWLRGENMDLKVARELSGSGDPIRAAKYGDVDPLRSRRGGTRSKSTTSRSGRRAVTAPAIRGGRTARARRKRPRRAKPLAPNHFSGPPPPQGAAQLHRPKRISK